MTRDRSSLLRAGFLLGIGLGGLVDGIVLRQLLQWHTMVSARLPPVDIVTARLNQFWDGTFGTGVWLISLVGLHQLWLATTRYDQRGEGDRFVGALLAGGSAYLLVEGLLAHVLLRLHHVRDFVANPAPWDWGLLALGGAIGILAWRLVRRPRNLGANEPQVRAPRSQSATTAPPPSRQYEP